MSDEDPSKVERKHDEEDKDRPKKDQKEDQAKKEGDLISSGVEIFKCSSLVNITRVWGLKVKDCVLPNQKVPCSYTQYVTRETITS